MPSEQTSGMLAERTGVLIIRAWVEPGSEEPLRARLRISSDISSGIERSVTLTEPDAVLLMVAGWLDDMLADPAGGEDGDVGE
jgi:hypothetical protein